MRRLLLIVLPLLLLTFVGLHFTGGDRAGRADFVFINQGSAGSLDPNRMSWLQDIRLGYALWEGLYTPDVNTLGAVPGAASGVEITPDGLQYTFHLRPDARWSNGQSVTSGDFIFAWRRMMRVSGNYSYLFNIIAGAKEYSAKIAASQSADFSLVGLRVLDDRTLRVTLDHPLAYFLDLCALPAFFPLHEPSMRPFFDSTSGDFNKLFTRPPHLVTNGAFFLSDWQFKRHLRLQANPYYWDQTAVGCRSIQMQEGEDKLWAFLSYDSGGADWLADASGEIGAQLWRQQRPDLHVFPGFGTYFYSINCGATFADGRTNPLADRRVRQALSLAIDRAVIVQTVTRMGEPQAFSYIPPAAFVNYRPPPGLGYDPARARRLLAEAGYPDGRGFPTLTLIFNNEFHHKDVAEVVQEQWRKNLGVYFELEGQEVKVFRQRLHGKDYAIARASWFGDYNDPSTFMDKYLSGSDNNDAGWKDAEYDRLCAQAERSTDQSQRMRLFYQAEERLLESQPIIPLYHYVNAQLFRSNVTGIPLQPRNLIQLKSVHVAQ